MKDSGRQIKGRRSSSVHSITHIELNQNVVAVRHPPPGVPLESRGSSTLKEIQARRVIGLTPLQDAPIYSGPFAFSPPELASPLDLKDLVTLEAMGGIESLSRGLGTHPIHGLLTGAPDHGHDHSSEGRPNAGIVPSRRHSPHSKIKQTSIEPKRLLVETCPPTSITYHHVCDGCNPYYAMLQERKQVFGANILLQHANKSWLSSMCCRLLYKALIHLSIPMVTSLALIPFHDSGMPRPSRVLPVDWVGGIVIMISILTAVVSFLNDWQKNRLGALNIRVVRDGVEHIIDANEVVVGDVALLEPGKVISCDGIFLSDANVKCDESATTGQIDAVKKATFPQCMARKQSPSQRVVGGEFHGSAAGDAGVDRTDCFIVGGSKVLEGDGDYVVVAVGMRSLNGQIMATHGAPSHVLSGKPFMRLLTRFRQPEVLPSIGSGTRHNLSIRLDYDDLATSSNLRGDPARSSSYIDMDLACLPEHHTPSFVFLVFHPSCTLT
ncbi:hypothetical protein SCLCIDRAFT_340070 [Scleroderma citrinum Foug A]|uniref:P-type ATPase A domain-containing protein n=1 Tax=Scleroderma citrinum Foug A TaxID=1036808 RepID=A0A0C3D1Y8_9AGAM|nr:hypothetical protein SCLCIDRAFT_340070 [Scleroderma citrinum Foug A]